VIARLDEPKVLFRSAPTDHRDMREAMIQPLEELLTGLSELFRPTAAMSAREGRPARKQRPRPARRRCRSRQRSIFKTVRFVHPDAPALLVLANYLRDTFLHRELRERVGFGGYAQAGVASGTFYFGSYRDTQHHAHV